MSAELRATLVGFIAVLLWGGLALLTTWTGRVPPFQLVAMSFSLAFGLALAKWIATGEPAGVNLMMLSNNCSTICHSRCRSPMHRP